MSQIVKCRGMTRFGQNCKRAANRDGGFCWQHVNHQEEKSGNSDRAKARKVPKPKLKLKSPEIIMMEENVRQSNELAERHKKMKKCAVEGCENYRFKGDRCVNHSCHHRGCKEPGIFGTYWCASHKCQRQHCQWQKWSKTDAGSSCLNHKCNIKDCLELRSEGRYCDQHMCSIKGCQRSWEGGNEKKKLCPLHQKQYALEKPEECPVCLEEFKKEEEPWPCGHYVHRTCITQSLKAECPMCRTKLRLRPEEEREITARSRQAQVERNEQMLAGLGNQPLLNEMALRFGPAYQQILMLMAGLRPDLELQVVGMERM